jgi:Ran GTPase-activating protein (RanGAP) involved in mRNA processing and transport
MQQDDQHQFINIQSSKKNKKKKNNQKIAVTTTITPHYFFKCVNFPFDVTMNDLRQYFKRAKIHRLLFSKDKKTAYIVCDNYAAKEKLLSYNHEKAWGREIRVYVADFSEECKIRLLMNQQEQQAQYNTPEKQQEEIVSEFNLPEELLMHIASYLPSQRDIFLRFSLVNTQFYQIVRSTTFWNIIQGDCRVPDIETTWLTSILTQQNFEQIILSKTQIHSNFEELFYDNLKLCMLSKVSKCAELVTSIIDHARNIERFHLENIATVSSQMERLFEKIGFNEYPNLKQLILRKVTSLPRGSLASALLMNTTITTLDISGVHLGVIGAKAIAEALVNNTTITHLNLFGCFVEVQGVQAIAKSLEHQKHITYLDLGMNRMRDTGFKSFIPVFKSNTILQTLKIRFNMLKDSGMKEVIPSLVHSKLKHLDLCFNFMSDMMCIELMNSLSFSVNVSQMEFNHKKDSVSRKTLYVSPFNSDMTDSGVIQFFKERIRCTAIKRVTMKYHNLENRDLGMQYAFVECADEADALQCVQFRQENPYLSFHENALSIALVGHRIRHPGKRIHTSSSHSRVDNYDYYGREYRKLSVANKDLYWELM